MRRSIAIIPILLFALFISTANLKKEISASEGEVRMQIKGFPGTTIDKCIDIRIKGQDVDHLIEPFKTKNETWCWQSEFWGKWMLSAVGAYRYTSDIELLKKMEYAVDGLIGTQMKNGYIGNYGEENQLTRWDIWGRKYCMLGLIKYYEVAKDKQALRAAEKVADHLISQVGHGKTNIIKTGFYHGMASSSVLEPIVYLYNHTRKEKYLDFAKYIVEQWNTEGGPDLVGKALQGINVADRFPPPEKWWSWENGQKAYEMMSCYDGLLELYKVTKEPTYLEAVIKTVKNIMQTEINIAGSGSAFECWYGTVNRQTQPTYHTMETCVTTTWMKLCNKVLELTHDPKYADEIEKSFYNALMASMKFDGSEIAKYSPLEGSRIEGEKQCDMNINCCNANGPRGFTAIPDFGLKLDKKDLYLNYYGESEATARISNQTIKIYQSTNYPESGTIEISVVPESELEFTLHLRIPAWSSNSSVSINGEVIENASAGNYLRLNRNWKKDDKILVRLDLRGQLHSNTSFEAITRGPIVLARDSRFGDGFVDETAVIQNEDGYVILTEISEKPAHVWMAFTAPCKLGTDLEGSGSDPIPIRFCDFASAGNTWDSSIRYRVWIPKTLNVMNRKYEGY